MRVKKVIGKKVVFVIAVMLLILTVVRNGSFGYAAEEEILYIPQASGQNVIEKNGCRLDASNIQNGYFMISYDGPQENIKMIITDPYGKQKRSVIEKGKNCSFPLNEGNGTYRVEVQDLFYTELQVSVEDRNSPYLYANTYVSYDKDSECVKKAEQLRKKSFSKKNFVNKVISYVSENTEYDQTFADSDPVNYIPDPDRTFLSGKGICSDYASLTAAMLRSQDIPVKMQFGYAGNEYHAWVEVYLDGQWITYDPTLQHGNSDESVQEYMEEVGYSVSETY